MFQTGNIKKKVAPLPLLRLAESWPPELSMIERLIRSPIPMPSGFVV
jgi:hypothetical protein